MVAFLPNLFIEEILRSGSVVDSEGKSIRIDPISIKCAEGMALYERIKKTKPKRTLEIGMAYGVAIGLIPGIGHVAPILGEAKDIGTKMYGSSQ